MQFGQMYDTWGRGEYIKIFIWFQAFFHVSGPFPASTRHPLDIHWMPSSVGHSLKLCSNNVRFYIRMSSFCLTFSFALYTAVHCCTLPTTKLVRGLHVRIFSLKSNCHPLMRACTLCSMADKSQQGISVSSRRLYILIDQLIDLTHAGDFKF